MVFAVAGRGYRYLPPDSEDVILPAFHGLSYTRFNISAPMNRGSYLRWFGIWIQ